MGFDLEDERNFSGLYAQMEWDPAPRWHFQVGARLNRTVEDREAGEEELDGGGDPGEEEEGGSDSRDHHPRQRHGRRELAGLGDAASGLWLFADYRNAYKPAAIDFGPEAEARHPASRRPPTATRSALKSRLGGGRFEWELTGFQMDFENLVVAAQIDDGLPELVNAGSERFKGVELEARARLRSDLWLAGHLRLARRQVPRLRPGLRRRAHPARRQPARDVGRRAWPRPG